ncbi:alkaline phosphatase family protein [Paraliomyxa miuraensis]|uniref:alkaline phosphatase family protein n=1 Tax=Paraliomyxa miuraensis TaxID=376150 RepID=UPI00225588D2|nr:alkaline phosphatase family protein [Paraliomyxa miuraensis]MCX4244303.1 alkaline phosphatase family protein [Paraliomyxa miuraensis]
MTRRRTLQGMGAVLGAVAVGCGDDTSGDGSGGSSGSTSEGDTTTSSSSGMVDSTGPGGSGDSSTGADGSSSSDTTGEPPADCSDNGGLTPEELLANIDTIVVVMMENRSLDHYFGSATFLEGSTVDGLTGRETNPRIDGTPVPVFEMANLQPADPPHGWDSCHLQWNLGANDGFVIEHELEHPSFYDEVMGYHVRAQLPVIYALADEYVLCDHWYSSVMGPTWPNRFYLHAATSGGTMNNAPALGFPTIWDQLATAGLSHANYYSDLAWAWGGFANPALGYTESLDEFFTAAAAGTLPAFSIVDPNFGILPGGAGGNDDHPSHDITLGQIFLGSIYQALAQSPQWERCLLIITYDEHGGFYDHVSPPTTVDEDPEFQQLGFRVPSLVIGPHVRRGCIDSSPMEHVSVIATASRRFGLPPLNDRVTATNDVSSAIDPAYLDDPRPPAPIPMMSISVSEVLSKVGTGQEELAAMVASGQIPLPADRRHPNASRDVALRMLDHAARLGVAKLRP